MDYSAQPQEANAPQGRSADRLAITLCGNNVTVE
jgi:hypothetical protein